MGRADPFGFLTAEHDRIRGRLRDALSAEGGDVGPLVAELRRHLMREEDALYPLCERFFGGRDGAIAVLRGAHTAIERGLASLDPSREQGTPARLRERLERLAGTVDAHLMQEERVLFPLVAARLSDAEAALLLQRIREGGRG